MRSTEASTTCRKTLTSSPETKLIKSCKKSFENAKKSGKSKINQHFISFILFHYDSGSARTGIQIRTSGVGHATQDCFFQAVGSLDNCFGGQSATGSLANRHVRIDGSIVNGCLVIYQYYRYHNTKIKTEFRASFSFLAKARCSFIIFSF